jgi:hypothetical protein
MSLRRSRAFRRSVHTLCLLSFLVPSLPIGLAVAQAPAASESNARVERLIARGIQSRDAGRDAEALDFYRQAIALDPENPRLLAHLGVTYLALGRWVSAHQYLLQALQFRSDPYIQRHVKELEEAQSTVAEHVGFLEVYGAPDGAEALLNGQFAAALPMSAPIPVTAGSYVLEVRFKDHYTLGRPIAIAPRLLTREEVALAPHREGGPSAPAPPRNREAPRTSAAAEPVAPAADEENGTSWLPWAFGGLSVVAAATSVVAWERREHYAERWNDDDTCLGVGISRQERCGSELDRGQRAETVLWVSGVAAGLFAGGAILSAIWSSAEEPVPQTSLRCVPGAGGAACFGTF